MSELETSFAAVEAAGVVAGRPLLSGASAYRDAAFAGFLRTGSEVETKAFTGVTGEAGGYAIPREIDAVIDATLKSVSPIRSIANVVQVGSAGYRKLVAAGGTPSGWAAETAGRPETGTPAFNEIAPPMGDLYANPAASQAMLDDAAFDVEAWLADEIGHEFAKAEGAAFVGGTGVNRPKGFLTYATAATGDATRPFGTLQYLASGAAGDFGANAPERLIDLVHSLRAPYRQGAAFVMNASARAGWSAVVADSGLTVRHDGSGWIAGVLGAARVEIDGIQVLSQQQAAIDAPEGGTIVDVEARQALIYVINALRAHGLIAV